MHTFLLFFAWPGGGAWSNIVAVPPCAILAAVLAFIFRDRIGTAIKSWWHRHLGHRGELDAIKARLDDHADALDLSTPGGLAAVMAELKDTRDAAESAVAEVRALAKLIAPTPMKRTPKDGGGRM